MKFENLIKSYEDTRFQIRRVELKINEMKQLYGFPSAVRYDSQPSSKSTNSSVESTLIRYDTLLQEKREHEQRLAELRTKIQTLIDSLENYTMREVVELKVFTANCGWKYIASKVYLSKSYCRKLFHDGVYLIDKSKFI